MDCMNPQWHENVLSMAKHKSMEVMERLNKEESDDLDWRDVEQYKNAAKTIYYIMSIEKSMRQQ